MRQTILTIILVVLLLASGFIWFRASRQGEPAAPAILAEGSERFRQYQHLKNLKPDIGIFADPFFRSLEATVPSGGPPSLATGGDLRPGRTNPFSLP
ncbi:MAG: hypothetical protein Q8R35_02695 [bacterium]|nr:hypothetical protein [bacterium]